MDKENIYELTLDDLQDQHREYAEVIGVDNLLRLSDNFGGTSIYIPQRRELEKNRIYRRIYQEFDGEGQSGQDACHIYSKFEDIPCRHSYSPFARRLL